MAKENPLRIPYWSGKSKRGTTYLRGKVGVEEAKAILTEAMSSEKRTAVFFIWDNKPDWIQENPKRPLGNVVFPDIAGEDRPPAKNNPEDVPF